MTSTVRANIYLDASGGNTAQINGMTPTALSLQGFRNRIINGDMRIDQRNAGAAVTVNSSNPYTVDRWFAQTQGGSVLSVQQVTDAPAGLVNSLKATVTTADSSIVTTDFAKITQRIEAYNMTDLGWGASGAQMVTLSFWVKASVTGTFGGILSNSAENYTYPFTYTVNSANTWEQKTVTISGPTAGTWLTTNGTGIQLSFSLGAGPTYLTTAGSWSAARYEGATGQTQLISTLNATWQITGVQLEAGSVATPFERRDYGRELIMCQRYYEVKPVDTSGYSAVGYFYGSNNYWYDWQFKVTKRATPTIGGWADASKYPSVASCQFNDLTSSFLATDVLTATAEL